MNTYELIYLIPSVFTEEQVAGVQKGVEELLKKEKAEVTHHKIWGRRKLAYRIKKVEHAYYVLLYFKAEPEAVSRIAQGLLIMQNVVRSRIFACDDFEKQKEWFIEEKRKEEPRKEEMMAGIDPVPASPVRQKAKRPISPLPRAVPPSESSIEEDAGPQEKKEVKKASLEDLDKKLESILEGEIEI